MGRSLYTRLAVIFISISLVSVIIISLIANISTGIMFKNYVSEKQIKRNTAMKSILINSYDKTQSFSKAALDEVDMYAMMDDLKVKITDTKGNILWSANYLEHHKMIETLNKLEDYNPSVKNYIENKLPIIKDNETIGMLIIGFNGEYSMSYSDIGFISSINKWLIISAFISVVIAFLLSILVSKKIAVPITKATEIAHSIKVGNLKKRLNFDTGTLEIAEFADTINHLAESLEEQEKLRRQLTSDVAHELRTPLATLQSHTEAILDGVWEPTKDRIESIHEEIVRISKLVKDIEKLTAIENESITLEKENFDLVNLAISISKNFEAAIKKNGMEIVIEGKPPIEIIADKDKLSQVLTNLISNAIKYTEAGGEIRIIVNKNTDNTQIIVKDTGTGIDNEHLQYIFERFYRADNSRTRATGGAGIGLAITKSIVEAHDGNIKVKSKKGVGTEFIILLPNK